MLVDAGLVSGPVAVAHQRVAVRYPILRRKVGRWRLIVRTDRFDARPVCSLTARDISVERGAVVFRLGPHVRAFDAEYRIDGGPAKGWRADAMTLAARGFALESDDLANPSDGLIPIPLPRLAGAQIIFIRPFVGARVRRFEIAGIETAVAAGDESGCAPQLRGTDAVLAGENRSSL